MMQQITQQTAYFLKKSAQASGEREEVSAVHASVRRGQKSARTERVEKVEVDAEAIKQRRPHRRRQEWELVRLLAPQSNGLLQGLQALIARCEDARSTSQEAPLQAPLAPYTQ